MKFFNLTAILAIAILFANCSKRTQISVSILEPGGITIPAHVKNIAVINRSLSPEQMGYGYQNAYSMERVIRDPRASQQVLLGLGNALGNSPRYQYKITEVQLPGAYREGNFPDPLDTGTLGKICRDFGADAVVALEDFGANVNNGVSARPTRQIINGATVNVTQYVASETVTIRYGFRIYDKVANSIDDQYAYSSTKSWSSNAYANEQMAMQNMIPVTDAVNQLAYSIGQNYARRIAPVWSTEMRSFYKKFKDPQMAEASRMAMTGDWKGAMTSWGNGIANLTPEEAGYAAFNMAVGCEVTGDLNQAQQWCEKSFTTYNNKQAAAYLNVLKQRVYNTQVVQQQMESTDAQQSQDAGK